MIKDLATLDIALDAKYRALHERLAGFGSLIVAFSGGVDSGLLAAVAYQALGEKMLAVTVQSPVETLEGVQAARALAEAVGFPHRVVDYNDLDNHQFVANPPERCYFCKRERLGELQRMASELRYAAVAEGSNADDGADYRPGTRAVAELNIISPLAELGFRKAEIRVLARALELELWNRPSAPCLATRFPYGTQITLEGIDQVAKGEIYLRERGYGVVRVRHYGVLARIEVDPGDIARLVGEREEITQYFKQIGFTHVAVDLLGYRSGSMNEVLKS